MHCRIQAGIAERDDKKRTSGKKIQIIKKTGGKKEYQLSENCSKRNTNYQKNQDKKADRAFSLAKSLFCPKKKSFSQKDSF